MNELPFRQVHLDFHTSPAIGDVGVNFDAREFARVYKKARVNNVNVFAKCHHGHLYYNTARAERHPGLAPDLDLLGEQVDALHREGIRATIYISILCDEYAANTHPEWVAREVDGRFCYPWGNKMESLFERPGGMWQIIDMSSPYQEFLAEQTAEILEKFKPVDGIWFDMTWNQPSCGKYAVEGMLRENLNPENADDRMLYAHRVARAYTKRFHDMVLASSADATVYFNCRPMWNLAEELDAQGQHEIESLATGGWGYMHSQQMLRWTRTFPKQFVGMTARFHRSWADFGGLKPYPALEYETSLMMAHGAKCSIGDQMHPRGILDAATYELIGKAYARVEEREPWLVGARPVTDIGVLKSPPSDLAKRNERDPSVEGATRMLTQLKHQFDIIGPHSDFEKYRLLILPDAVELDEPLRERTSKFLKAGGALLASGISGLSEDASAVLLPELGIETEGLSSFTDTYFRVEPEFSAGIPATEHVMYERGARVTAKQGAISLARILEPYFERAWNHFCSHRQTPFDQESKYSAVVQNGRCAYIAYPIFKAFADFGNQPFRLLVRNLIERLLPEPILKISGPTTLETSVMQQENRTVIHLLHYPAERRAPGIDLIEDIIPLHDIELSLRAENVVRVYLAPSREPLEYSIRKQRVHVTLPRLDGHAMIVFET